MLLANFFVRRAFSSASSGKAKGHKIAVLGAAGGIGQPLSLLLKSWGTGSDSVSHLALYDVANVGLAVDLEHIPTPIKVTGHSGKERLAEALQDASVVVIPAGVPRKPGMTRDDLFNINAGIVRDLTLACAKTCPNAHLLIISNPVNSTVPISYEILKKSGVTRPSVFGVTTLDVVRAQTFLGQSKALDPRSIKIDVVGGHSGPTIVPLFSSVSPSSTLSQDELLALTQRVQYGGDEVVKAKDGGGSATLSMAFAANEFIQKFLAALDGQKNVIQNTFIYSEQWKDLPNFFAGRVLLGPKGLDKVLPLPVLSAFEKELMEKAVQQLEKDIAKGIDFVAKA